MAVVQLSDVSIVRPPATLLDRITWTVQDDDRWVIVGPNGAGKTTLLQVVGAQWHPSSGTAVLLDETMGRVDVFELRPRIGIASEAMAGRIPRSESVVNVVVSAAYAVMGRWTETYDGADFARAAELMRRFGVDHLAERTFGTLSEGERKRVQIARALMTDPELLLLDEPGAGLDLAGRERLVGLLGGLCENPLAPAIVLVTHHIEEIPTGITHALMLKGGRIVAAGPIGETLTSDVLSETFDYPLAVAHVDGRWSARAARAW